MNHRAAGFQASFCNGKRVIEFAKEVELKMTHFAVCPEEGLQYSCTVNSAGGRQGIVLWDSQCEPIDSSARRHSRPVDEGVGSTVWFVAKILPKCSVGNEVPSVYPNQN